MLEGKTSPPAGKGQLGKSFQALQSSSVLQTFHKSKTNLTCDARCSVHTLLHVRRQIKLFFAFRIRHCYSQQHVEPALLYEPLSLFLFSPNKQQVSAVLLLYLNSRFDWSNPSHSHFQRSIPPQPTPPASTLVQLSFLLQTFFEKFMIMKSQFPHQAVHFTSSILLCHDSCSNDQNDEQLKGVKEQK